jgi:hypothetical protein
MDHILPNKPFRWLGLTLLVQKTRALYQSGHDFRICVPCGNVSDGRNLGFWKVRWPPEAEPCDRIEEARDVRLSSKPRKKRSGWAAWGIHTKAKSPVICKIKPSRGLKTRSPDQSPGLAQIKL